MTPPISHHVTSLLVLLSAATLLVLLVAPSTDAQSTCKQPYYVQVKKTTSYTTRCGWWARCTRYRAYYVSERRERCCSGHGGSNCLPVCSSCYNGRCTSPNRCTCSTGWIGTDCRTAVCSQGCLNGRCTSPNRCLCDSGWTGADCGTDIDECASDPCQNGGNCTDLVNGFRCACPAGYTGATCQTDIDDCAAEPCENGATCEDRVADFFCRCAPGYDGKNCSVEIDECASDPCQNGATCTDQINGYTCQCNDGFTGIHCETNIDECASAPCRNEGTCHDLVNGYRCECRVGIRGVECETPILDCSGVKDYKVRTGYILDPTDCRCYYRCNRLGVGKFYRDPRECCPRRMYWDGPSRGCNLIWKVNTTGCIGNDTSFDPGYGEGSGDADPVTLPPLDPLEDCPYEEDRNFRRNYKVQSARGGWITMPCPKDLCWNQAQCTCADNP